MFLPGVVSAKTIKDIACNYKVFNPNGEHMTKIQILITNYNDGKGDGKLSIFFENKSGNLVSYTGPTSEWLNYGKTDSYSGNLLRIFTTDKKGKDFASNYKENNRCPSLVSNWNGLSETIDVEGNVIDSINGETTSKVLTPYYETLRSDTGDWLSREDFYKGEDGKTTLKEDLVCEYSMEFDMYNITTPVVFTTMYAPGTNEKTYKARLNNSEYNIPKLADGIVFNLGQGGSNLVKIEGIHLQKIFEGDTCLEGNQIYHYYDNNQNIYVITTDKNEASENATGGRYDNADEPGANDNPYTDGDINVTLNIKYDCDIFSDDMKDWLIQLLDMIKIVGLVLAAILSMVDFLKGVGTGSADTMKKVWKSVGNRLIAVILLFLLPVLIEFIFGLVTIEGVDITNPLCGIK